MSEPQSLELDELWTALEPHIEWPAGLALILLFASHPQPVDQLHARVEALLGSDGRTLRTLIPRTVEELPSHASELLVPLSDEVRALWVELWRGSGGAGWDSRVGTILQQLNERRTALERVVRRPTVLVLPASMRARVYVIAPDLWTIRSFTADLPSPPPVTRVPTTPVTPTRPTFALPPPSREEKEWARLIGTGEHSRIDVWDGLRASNAALERGRLSSARHIAQQVLNLNLHGKADGDSHEEAWSALTWEPTPTQPLLAAIQTLGVVEAEMGNLASARMLFQRMLSMSEQLVTEDPRDQTALRNLAVSLNNLSEVELEMGNVATARVLVQRAIDVLEQLAAAPHNLRDQRGLSISLNRLGKMETDAGNLTAARVLLLRSLRLSEQLATTDPDHPETQRHLSISLERLGMLESHAGDLPAARGLFQRSLDVRTQIVREHPHSVQAQEDLVEAHLCLFVLARQLDDVKMQRDHVDAAQSVLDSWTLDLFANTRAQDLRQRIETARNGLGPSSKQ